MQATTNGNDETNSPISKTFRLPALFPSDVVIEAFGELRHPASVQRILRKLNAYEGHGLVKPTVLQDHYPTIYRRCCAILLERSLGERGAA